MKQGVRIILWPLSCLYNGITAIRNVLFTTGIKKSIPPGIFSLGVGNLSVGGTGKTPMIQYLLRLFSAYSIATLSRGYGRQTRGFREVLPSSTPQEVGDEPLLFPRSGVRSFVCAQRVEGWKHIALHMPDVQVLLLDDVFQHRAIRPFRLILLTTFDQPFFNDFLLPSGRLRESRAGAHRADVVVVTKCPAALSFDEQEFYKKRIRHYTSAPVFFAHERYGQPYNLWDGQGVKLPQRALAVAGLANPQYFFQFLSSQVPDLSVKAFSDHYDFGEEDLVSCFAFQVPVIITEKDAVKWKQFPQFSNKNVIVWPIQVEFTQQNEFDSLLLHWYADYLPHS